MNDPFERLRAALSDRYAVESEIGRGGMATVYLAEDLRHDRRVAIKVLHPELTVTLGADRFLQEIRIVAGLQHPHILPLYDSGEADGLLFYVMPYAEGESLRQRLDRERQLSVEEAARITGQVADALDYAHRKGVIHRDIKPGNILLAEGHATIADFGIARAIEASQADRFTSTGLGVGTPLYASPEQATGEEALDGRTDIYSLGCVLYELLAGEPPLTGTTPQMIRARRLSETPTPLHGIRDTVPPALDRVIARALARFPADRFPTVGEFGQAVQEAVQAATQPITQESAPAAGSRRGPGAAPTLEAPAPAPAPAAGTRRIDVPLVLLALLIAASALLWLASRGDEDHLRISVSNVTQVTNAPGVEFQPAISPDGSEVAYVEGHVGRMRLAVRSTTESGGGGGIRPADQEPGRQWSPAWTPDGSSIRYCASVSGGCEWKEVGKLGGFVRSVSVPRASTRHAWSPDGSRAVFAASDSIFSWSSAEDEPELLAVHTRFPWGPHSFAWSPDGRWVAYVNGNPGWRVVPNVANSSVWLLPAVGGEPVPVTDDDHLNVSPQWFPDSRHLLFVSDRGGVRGIHVIEVGENGPVDSARSVLPSADTHSISISADGRKLAYSSYVARQNIRSIPISDAGAVSIGEAVSVARGNQVVELHRPSPDGTWITFDSQRRGEHDIYKLNLDDGTELLVADIEGNAGMPDWSPSGDEIAFHSEEGEVLVVPADGGTPRVIADFAGFDGGPRWSPDGLTVAFESEEGASEELPYSIWLVSRDSVGAEWNEPGQLTSFDCGWPAWLPDGDSLLCTSGDGWAQVSTSGEILARYEPAAVGLRRLNIPHVSPDGSRIYFVSSPPEGGRGLWWIPTGGGQATRVARFDDPSLVVYNHLSVGPDNIYLTVGESESDIRVADLEW